MDCPSEEQLVRMALADRAEVQRLEFDLADRRLAVIHSGGPAGASAIQAALDPIGLGARLETSAATQDAPLGDAPRDAPPDDAPHGGRLRAGVRDHAAERRTLWLVLAINAAMFVGELVAGLLARSTGLLADAVDMLADATVYGIALLGVGAGAAAQRRSARASGWLQLALAGLVLVEVVRRAVLGSQPLELPMIVVGLVALAANITCLLLLAGHRTGGLHMRASWIFTTNDVLANVGVILAGLLVGLTGSGLPDLVVGTGIALLVASGAWRILRLT
jgi:Co/Zn/Cd efflux system component